MGKLLLLWIIACAIVPVHLSGQQVSVIPYPKTITLQEDDFLLEEAGIWCADRTFQPEVDFLKEKLGHLSVPVKAVKKKSRATIVLQSVPVTGTGEEAYRLDITAGQIVISAANRTGIFYGIQTLLQLIGHEGTTLKCCQIEDAPRYVWRGYMLDESRHFFGKEKVKQLLDWMAYFKLNKFHWHLTDESGWRIEIKKYPKLATVGGKGNWSDPNCLDVKYYTQEDIREIVAYAAARHIEVIPEIDMPGHATAANMAYPSLSGGGTPEHPDFTFNVGKEEVYAFLTDVLREVITLFPSSYLHIGGDEVAFGIKAWETDSAIQALMKQKGMKDVKEAERYFMHRMVDSVRMLGKTLVGWDELIDLKVPVDGTMIMWWRHDRVNQLKKSLEDGYTTIMCPRRPLYFDFIQHKDHKWGRVWSGFCPLEDVYAFPDKGMASWRIPADQLKLIRGIQANVWTERIHNTRRVDFMTFPRLCALAESGWTVAELKDYESFSRRMEKVYPELDRDNIYYFDARNPDNHPEPAGPQQKKREVPMDFRD